MTDFKFIFHYLHGTGDHANFLPNAIQFYIRLEMANGFGKLASSTEGLNDIIWDWSHVRDSSPDAIERMAAFIRHFVLNAGR